MAWYPAVRKLLFQRNLWRPPRCFLKPCQPIFVKQVEFSNPQIGSNRTLIHHKNTYTHSFTELKDLSFFSISLNCLSNIMLMTNLRVNTVLFSLVLGCISWKVSLAQQGIFLENELLKDTRSGKEFKFSELQDKKAIVVVFTSSDCAFSMKYQERINSLHDTYQNDQVAFVAINSNDPTLNSEDAAKRMRIQMPYKFPYIKDASQKVAESLEASRNPEAFVLVPRASGGFEIAYRGQIDDNPLDPSFVENHYLKNAIEAVINNEVPAIKETEPTGCNIKWQKH